MDNTHLTYILAFIKITQWRCWANYTSYTKLFSVQSLTISPFHRNSGQKYCYSNAWLITSFFLWFVHVSLYSTRWPPLKHNFYGLPSCFPTTTIKLSLSKQLNWIYFTDKYETKKQIKWNFLCTEKSWNSDSKDALPVIRLKVFHFLLQLIIFLITCLQPATNNNNNNCPTLTYHAFTTDHTELIKDPPTH